MKNVIKEEMIRQDKLISLWVKGKIKKEELKKAGIKNIEELKKVITFNKI